MLKSWKDWIDYWDCFLFGKGYFKVWFLFMIMTVGEIRIKNKSGQFCRTYFVKILDCFLVRNIFLYIGNLVVIYFNSVN